jgi:hypothetical protein
LPEFARIPSLKSVSSSSYVIGSSSASGNPWYLLRPSLFSLSFRNQHGP